MRLNLLIGGEPRSLELRKEGETYKFRLGSQEERAAIAEEVEPGVYSVLLGGRSYEARVSEGGVEVDGRRIEVEAVDPRRRAARSGRRAADGRMAASMPGKVIRVLVREGDEVKAGQGVVVVEAMKMQNEMKAPRAGRIMTLAAREGATVNSGELLAEIG